MRWKYKDFWWLLYQPLSFCLHFETLLFKNLFLFLQRNFWRCSQLPFIWLWYEFDMGKLFNTLQQYHLHWEVSTNVKSAGTLATVTSPGFTFQVICDFYRTITDHVQYSFLGQSAVSHCQEILQDLSQSRSDWDIGFWGENCQWTNMLLDDHLQTLVCFMQVFLKLLSLSL